MATKNKAAAKTARTTGSKPSKPVKKVAPAKKIAPKKAILKVIPKKVGKPVGKPSKPIVRVSPKKVTPFKKTAPAKKTAPVKKVVPAKRVTTIAKTVTKQVKVVTKSAKPVVKQVIKKPVAVKAAHVKAVQTASKPPMAKKEEVKKTVTEKAVAPRKPVAEIKAKDIKVPVPKPVVIPKIATKTVRKYQPDFTKSVLDKSERDPGAPTQRYSDPELLEFKELIQRKLEAAKKELAYLHGLITRKDEMGGDEGDNRYMTMEDGSLSMEREQLSQMASRQITFIDHLEKAIMRIENKTYGICRVTGKLIDKARLRAVPHATLSIEAKMGTVK